MASGIRGRDLAALADGVLGTKSSPAWRLEAIRWIVKTLWEEGSLCYVNRADEWGREEREYRATAAFYPSLDLKQLTNVEAEKQLVLHHIEQYGPVELGDIAWWSGLSAGRVLRAIVALGAEIERVDVEGLGSGLYVARKDFEALSSRRAINDHWVALLAYEDPALKGYFTTRHRYVHGLHYQALFNAIGEVRASVILDGLAVGVWTLQRERHQIEVTFFKRIDKAAERMVNKQSNVLLAKLMGESCASPIELAG